MAALLVLLLPMLRLTGAMAMASKAPPAIHHPEKKAAGVHLELTSTRIPFHFELRHLGKVIWSGEGTQSRAQKDLEMDFPKEGVDLELKGSWTEGEIPGAIKLTVILDAAAPLEKTVWAQQNFDEVLTFP